MRLILPQLDKERANYGLKEAVLAKLLAEALGLSKDAEDAIKLQNWRKGGQRAGSNAGNFPFVAAEVLYRRQKTTSGGLKIGDINRLLDRLAAAQDSKEKTAVLAEIINRTNVQEMRWIIMIILKELKLGISEKTVFSVFHPDAEDLFNVTCDLKLVCEKLCDRNQRYKRQVKTLNPKPEHYVCTEFTNEHYQFLLLSSQGFSMVAGHSSGKGGPTSTGSKGWKCGGSLEEGGFCINFSSAYPVLGTN
jgi:ATP-dependent DNA ligase